MRKSFWIMLAVLVVAVSAPNAHADEFQYTYTITAYSHFALSWETVPIPGVTAQVDLLPSSLASMTVTGSMVAGCKITNVTLDRNGAGDQTTAFNACGTAIFDEFNLPLADYTTPGTYSFTASDPNLVVHSATLVVSEVTAPEPSSVALMLLGVGLVFVLRKRNSRGHQLAA
jgi:PEP-CTERM motif